MFAPPLGLWFRPQRVVVVRPSEPWEFFQLLEATHPLLLGEGFARRATALLAGPTPLESFDAERWADGSVVRQRFLSGPPLAARVQAMRLSWQPGIWQQVAITPLVWSDQGLTPLDSVGTQWVVATAASLPLEAEWQRREVELLLTPYNDRGECGPSESLPLSRQRAGLVGLLRDNGLAGTGTWLSGDPVLRRLGAWPAPLTDALVRLLRSAIADQKFSCKEVLMGLCRALGVPREIDVALEQVEQRPRLASLLLSELRLLELAIKNGLVTQHQAQSVDDMLLALAPEAYRGPLRERLQTAEASERRFWVGAFKRNLVSPPLLRLRAMRGVAVEPDEAPTIEPHLSVLEATDPSVLVATLTPHASLHALLARALETRQRATHHLRLLTIQQAQQADEALRRALRDRLQQCMSRNPGPPWEQLGSVMPTLDERYEEIAQRLLSLQGATPPPEVPLPEADFQIEATWLALELQRRLEHQESQQRAVGWCAALIEQGQLLQPEQADSRGTTEASELLARWEVLRGQLQALSPREIRDLFQELGTPGHRQVDLERLCRRVEPLLADTLLAHLPAEFLSQSSRLTLLLEQANLRETVQRRREQMQGEIRCTQMQERLEPVFAALQQRLDEPPWTWGRLLEPLRQGRALLDEQNRAVRLWQQALTGLPSSLATELGTADFRFDQQELDRLGAELTQTEQRLRDEEQRCQHAQRTIEEVAALLQQPLSVEPVRSPFPWVPEPSLATLLYRRLQGVLEAEQTVQEMQRMLDLHSRQLLGPMEEHLRNAFAGPALPGLFARADESEHRQRVWQLLREMLQRRDEGLPEALRAVPRLVRGLRLWADLRGENRSPAGYRLLNLPLAEQLPPDSPVGPLRDLACRPLSLPDLLTNPLALENWLGELLLVAELRPRRRWWSTLYRDLYDHVVDQLTQVEMADARYRLSVWDPGSNEQRVDVRVAVDRLERMAQERESLPAAVVQLLSEHRLLSGAKA